MQNVSVLCICIWRHAQGTIVGGAYTRENYSKESAPVTRDEREVREREEEPREQERFRLFANYQRIYFLFEKAFITDITDTVSAKTCALSNTNLHLFQEARKTTKATRIRSLSKDQGLFL